MAQRRCSGCMQMVEGAFCPHCGWPEGKGNEAHQLQPGTLLRGQYEVGKVLGQGGFGITYLGWDRQLETAVCIKEYFPSHVVSRDCSVSTVVHCHTEQGAQSYYASRERFLREAKVLAQFRDIPEIVGIYNFFEENNTAYIVMEYIRGTDLANYIRRKGGRLTPEETFRILKPIMQAMAAVHRGELVHRDIAPDNIMLHPRGGAKLLDFGAARMVEGADVDKGLNRSTEAIVKHGFAPMEQYQTRGNLGPWTDVYAMCATVYYCLTGQIPPEATSRMMGDAEVNWAMVAGLTDRQRWALEKGMAIFPRDRYATMEQLMDGLFSANPQTQPLRPEQRLPNAVPMSVPNTPPAPRKKKGKGLLIGLAACAVALAAGIALLTTLPRGNTAPSMEAPPAEAPRAEAPLVEVVPNEECYLVAVSGTDSVVTVENIFACLSVPGRDFTFEHIVYESVDEQVEMILGQLDTNPPDAILWAPDMPIPEDRLQLVGNTADVYGVPVILTGFDPSVETGSCTAIETTYRLCYAGVDPRTVSSRLVQALDLFGLDQVDIDNDDTVSYLLLLKEPAHEAVCQEYIDSELELHGFMGRCLQAYVDPYGTTAGDAVETVLAQYGNDLEVVFCLDEEIAWEALMVCEAGGIAVCQDIFIVTAGGDEVRDSVNSGRFACGVKAGYDLRYAAVNQALTDGLLGEFTEEYYRPSCELVVPAASAASQAGSGVMTHEEFLAAELDSMVVVETYVQGYQSWWNNTITVYCQSPDGGYLLYELACSEKDAARLTPGTKIRVTGYKGEWAGELEIIDGTFEFVSGDRWLAEPFDATALLGTEKLIAHQNERVIFRDMTVDSIEFKNGEPGDDIYVTVRKNGSTYEFVVELYLTGPETEVYQAVSALRPGDVVDIEGFLYWYEGVNTHITGIYPAG